MRSLAGCSVALVDGDIWNNVAIRSLRKSIRKVEGSKVHIIQIVRLICVENTAKYWRRNNMIPKKY